MVQPSRREYVVEERDGDGHPTIVSVCEVTPPSQLKLLDDKKLGKKRLREREALRIQDQQELEKIFKQPKQLKAAVWVRERVEGAFEKIKTLDKARETTTVSDVAENEKQSEQAKHTPSPKARREVNVDLMGVGATEGSLVVGGLWIAYLSLSFLFLAVAIFPDLTYLVGSSYSSQLIKYAQ
jgi:hypothetical protein